jgi:uncharacterized protein (UPF0335 family)
MSANKTHPSKIEARYNALKERKKALCEQIERLRKEEAMVDGEMEDLLDEILEGLGDQKSDS